MKKILIIPHHPALPDIKIRLIEIAKTLAKENEVYLVNWSGVVGRYTLAKRVVSNLRDIFSRPKICAKDGINIVSFPLLRRPLGLACRINSAQLFKIIKQIKIDALINGSYYMFDIPEIRNFKYIFDFADLPVAGLKSNFDRFINWRTRHELEKADAVTVSSSSLKDYVFNNYHNEAKFIPNGCDLEKIRSVKKEEVEIIRSKYNLTGKWVVGYIGRIGEWVDTDLLIAAFKAIKSKVENAALLIIGTCPKNLKDKLLTEGAVFTGGIKSEEIHAYFSAIDVGTLPSSRSLFQDLAFHIKIIEYAAARKIVVSTALEEVKRMAFPNVILALPGIEGWVAALESARGAVWHPEWDNLADSYDWARLGKEFLKLIE